MLVHDDKIVIAFNTDKPYPGQTNSTSMGPKLRQMNLPSYELNTMPYLCAAPASPDYTGALLGCLGQERFPIIATPSGFRLDPDLADKWFSLENFLSGIARVLLEHISPFVPLEYKFPRTPRTLGYQNTFQSRIKAIQVARNSRDAFQPLIAHVAWAAILHRDARYASACKTNLSLPSTLSELDKGWSDFLISECQVHRAWVNELKISAVCDFNIERAGVVIRNPKSWVFSSRIKGLVISSVPVWIIWGDSMNRIPNETWTKDLVTTFGPSLSEVHSVMNGLANKHGRNQKASINEHDSEIDNSVSIRCDPRISEENITASNSGKTIHEWIELRKSMIDKAKLTADDEKQRSWQQRQINSERGHCPGKLGPIVYEWDRDESDRPVRSRVNRSNVEHVWFSFGNRQRWFNCVANEWELCRELDPSDAPEDSDSEYCLDEVEGHTIDGCLTQHGLEEHVNVATLADKLRADLASPETGEISEIGSDTYRLLSIRFGFSYDQGAKYNSMSKPPLRLAKVIRITGGNSLHSSSPPAAVGMEASIIQFVMFLDAIGHPSSSGVEVPSALYDLHLGNHRFLGNMPSAIRIRAMQTEDKLLYFLDHELDEGPGWKLAVADPCTALQAQRMKPSSMSDLTHVLIRSRTPFFTFKPASVVIKGSSGPFQRRYVEKRIGLGLRPDGHTFDKTDYVAYEYVKERLLKNKRIARAVIKRGGILSRLASGLVDETDILDGPSTIHEEDIQIKFKVDGSFLTYFDDGLSEEEQSTFVGLYSIHKGRIQ